MKDVIGVNKYSLEYEECIIIGIKYILLGV